MARGRIFPVQTVDLGPVGNFGTFNEAVDTAPWAGQLGMVVEAAGKAWRLVQVDISAAGTVDSIDGGVAYWEDKSLWTVHFDASAGEALANGVAGGTHLVVDVSTYTADRYIWVQCGGDQAAVVVATSTVAADHLTGHASTDNVLTRTAAGTAPVDIPVATALTTRASTTSDEGAAVANSSKVRWILGNLL